MRSSPPSSSTPSDADPSPCIDAKKFRDNWLHPGKTAEVVHIYLASSADLRSSVRAQKFHNTLLVTLTLAPLNITPDNHNP